MAIEKPMARPISRRTLLLLGAAAASQGWGNAQDNATSGGSSPTLRLGLLHLEPTLGEMDRNCAQIENGMRNAAASGAQWIVTSELAVTGYRFDLTIGTGWIRPGPDRWTNRLREVARELGVVLFLGHLEMDPNDRNRYNTAFVIGPKGDILGRHRKINTIPVAEEWSTRGPAAAPVQVGDISVGILICADAWPSTHASALAAQGARVLISPATWPPEPHGPEQCWEQRTRDTGLPLFVCNRTGIERDFDIRAAESVAVSSGHRLVRHTSERSTVLRIDWDLASQTLLSRSAVEL